MLWRPEVLTEYNLSRVQYSVRLQCLPRPGDPVHITIDIFIRSFFFFFQANKICLVTNLELNLWFHSLDFKSLFFLKCPHIQKIDAISVRLVYLISFLHSFLSDFLSVFITFWYLLFHSLLSINNSCPFRHFPSQANS